MINLVSTEKNIQLLDKLFKYFVTRFTNFAAFGINHYGQNDKIAKTGFEMAMFFNGKDITKYNDFSVGDTIYFLDDNKYKSIYNKFIARLIIKDGKDGKYISPESNKYCKIEYVVGTELTNLEYADIEKIFDLYIGGKTEQYYTSNKKYPAMTNSKGEKLNFSPDNINILNFNKKKNEKIYFANPLIKYLFLILQYLSTNKPTATITAKPTAKPTAKTPAKTTDIYDNIYRRIAVFYIYKYISFICEQGRSIMTNLEHLKFYFLSRTNGLSTYNKQCDEVENQIVEISKKQTKTEEEKAQLKQLRRKMGKAFYCTAIDNCDNLKTGNLEYFYDTPYSKDKSVINMQERVNIGQMKTMRLLDILQDLAGNAHVDKMGLVQSNSKYTLNVKTPLDTGSSASTRGAIFVMLTNIKIFRDDCKNATNATNAICGDNGDTTNEQTKKNLPQICVAELDTLRFAQSISSTTQQALALQQTVAVTGGSIKHYRKFNITDLKPKHNIYRRTKKVKSIKRNNNQRPQRTKKNN